MSDTPDRDNIIDVEPQVISDQPAADFPSANRPLWRKIGIGATIGILCALAGGLVYRDLLAGYFPSDQLLQLSQRVQAIDTANRDNLKRVDAVVALTEELKAKLGAAQAASDKSAKLNADTAALAQANQSALAQAQDGLGKVTSDLADIKAGTGTAGSPSASDASLAARVALLEKKLTEASPSVAPPQDIGKELSLLKAAIDSGAGFNVQLAPLATRFPNTAGLAEMQASVSGLPNAASLAALLNDQIASMPKGAAPQPASGGWSAWFYALMGKVVTTRPKSGTEFTTLASKASAFAAAGDLQQATEVLLSGGASLPPALLAWQEKAQQRLRLERAYAAFSSAVSGAGKG